MKQFKNKAYPFKWLTGITVLVLAGIIALQVYWLVASYQEQKSRFTADIENAIIATSVKIEMDNGLRTVTKSAGDSVSGMVSDKVTEVFSKIPKDVLKEMLKSENVVYSIHIDSGNAIGAEKRALQRAQADMDNGLAMALDKDSFEVSDAKLEEYQSIFQQELDKRGIKAPFELALVDKSFHIAIASCDTGLFRAIEIKSVLDDRNGRLTLGNYSLQAAFPEAEMYMIKRMLWVLVVTVLLIVIGCCSLGYLLVLFFQQKRLSYMRNDFMNNMTHELKTPISSISVALEMILDKEHGIETPKKTQYLQIAQGELKRLNTLVETVLKMSSLERSDIQMLKEPVVVKELMQDVKDSMQPLLDYKSAQLVMNVQPESLSILADKTHLVNVMQNLVENALKYNDKQVPEINIDVHEEKDHVSITVADNGKGIPAKYTGKIFDKFFRVPSGDRHDVKGYGLGLSYVKAIVQLHKGSVSVQSIPGKGSIFAIHLPR